jgi:hypothetical protein
MDPSTAGALKRPFDALSPSASSDSGDTTVAFGTGASTAITSAVPTPSYSTYLQEDPQQLAKKLRLKFGTSSKDAHSATAGDKAELDRRRDAFLSVSLLF